LAISRCAGYCSRRRGYAEIARERERDREGEREREREREKDSESPGRSGAARATTQFYASNSYRPTPVRRGCSFAAMQSVCTGLQSPLRACRDREGDRERER
jgi:hypothetical protein